MTKNISDNNDETEPLIWARIVIVAYNSGDILQKCIDCLKAQTHPDFEVVIVDNQSQDDAVKNLTLPDKRFSILKASRNLGFSGGSNFGAADAKTEWIITLNPDAHVSSTWIEELKKASEKYPTYSMLSPVMLDANNPAILDGCGDAISIFGLSWRGGQGNSRDAVPLKPCRVLSPCGASAAYRRDVFEKANGFDESFFCYIEDIDLGLRLNRVSQKCLLVPTAIVFHVGSSTLGKSHPLIAFLSRRNTIFMIVKNYQIIHAIIALPLYISLNLYNVVRNPRRNNNTAILKGLGVGFILAPKYIFQRIKNKITLPSHPTAKHLPMIRHIKTVKKSPIVSWKA